MTETIECDVADGIMHIRIVRPEKRNAITKGMAGQIKAFCDQANRDPQVKCVVLSGAGDKAFCAGSDINLLDEYGDAWGYRNRDCYNAAVLDLKKPSIAALKGWVLGGGLELAVGCDIRVASTTARLGAPEVGLGWLGAGGSSQMLPRLLGYGQASRILFTGEPIGADEALRIGLIEMLTPEGDELAAAMELAARIAKHDLLPLISVKSALRFALAGLDDGRRYENELSMLGFAVGSGRKGREAFARKGGRPDR